MDFSHQNSSQRKSSELRTGQCSICSLSSSGCHPLWYGSWQALRSHYSWACTSFHITSSLIGLRMRGLPASTQSSNLTSIFPCRKFHFLRLHRHQATYLLGISGAGSEAGVAVVTYVVAVSFPSFLSPEFPFKSGNLTSWTCCYQELTLLSC